MKSVEQESTLAMMKLLNLDNREYIFRCISDSVSVHTEIPLNNFFGFGPLSDPFVFWHEAMDEINVE